LQAALWQEAFHLVKEGIASVEDIDTAIAHGPGLGKMPRSTMRTSFIAALKT
jgi:3-hydroxyacyl-CoA dehydrogenase